MARIKMTRELWKLGEEALTKACIAGSDGLEYDGHEWAHRIAEALTAAQVDELAPVPSDTDRRESAAGKVASNIVAASRRRPRLDNTLLRNCGLKEVIPDELILLPGKRYRARKDMYASDQWSVADRLNESARDAVDQAEYEKALATPFVEWERRELKKGRPRSQLTQMTFWLECGHVTTRPPDESEAEGRWRDKPPPGPVPTGTSIGSPA